MEIDWDRLDRIQDRQQRCRNVAFLDLSPVYVPGEGPNKTVGCMIIGEAPGAQEEIKCRPFVGDSGLILRELMSIAGLYTGQTPELGEANCWLTNVIKFRPPRNRTPTLEEIKFFRVYLRHEWIAVGRPTIIILVGGVAFRAVMGRYASITKIAGKVMCYKSKQSGLGIHIWPMIHPSYGLRNPSLQPLIEKDWEALEKWMNNDLC